MNSEFTNLEFLYRLLALMSLFLSGYLALAHRAGKMNQILRCDWLSELTETFSVTMCLYNSVSVCLSQLRKFAGSID